MEGYRHAPRLIPHHLLASIDTHSPPRPQLALCKDYIVDTRLFTIDCRRHPAHLPRHFMSVYVLVDFDGCSRNELSVSAAQQPETHSQLHCTETGPVQRYLQATP